MPVIVASSNTDPDTATTMYVFASQVVDYVTVGLGLAGLISTVVGLSFVVVQLRRTAEQQRTEAGPYVRVDLGSLQLSMDDFERPRAYFHNHTEYVDLATGDESASMLVAWFRNYQGHPLGMALGVTATFSIDDGSGTSFIKNVYIPYLERGKAVAIDLVRCPSNGAVEVTLISISFLDFYDHRHEHSYGEAGTNALHGRLRALIQEGRLESVPEGRSRGSGIDLGLNV